MTIMSIKFLQVAKFMFKSSCFVIVLCMISIWINRFIQDDDLCLVEYKPFRNANDVDLPDASLCFTDPFDEHKLNVMGTTTDAYLEHLAGNGFNDSLTNINCTDVIFNFGDYYNGTYVVYKDGTNGSVAGVSLPLG